MKVTASCQLNGHGLNDIAVLNPGEWFGKAWLLELGGSYTPLFLVVEADTISDAIDVLSDDPLYGPLIRVPDDDLPDRPEESRRYDGSGRVLALQHVMVHGREGCDLPFAVKYHIDGIPERMDPRRLAQWQYN